MGAREGQGLSLIHIFAEIVRAGYESLDRGPLEAARALGLTRVQTAVSVALPQICLLYTSVLRGAPEAQAACQVDKLVKILEIHLITRIGSTSRSRSHDNKGTGPQSSGNAT